MKALPILYFLLLQNVQAPAPLISFETLKATANVAFPQASAGVQELTVNWNAFAGAAGQLLSSDAALAAVNTFEVVARQVSAGSLQRERNPELSADQLVAIGADLTGTMVSWSLIKDPRIVRAEQPGPDGVLTGRILYRATTQLTLALPDLPQLIQVGLYQPRWTGTTWILDLIATFAVAGPR